MNEQALKRRTTDVLRHHGWSQVRCYFSKWFPMFNSLRISFIQIPSILVMEEIQILSMPQRISKSSSEFHHVLFCYSLLKSDVSLQAVQYSIWCHPITINPYPITTIFCHLSSCQSDSSSKPITSLAVGHDLNPTCRCLSLRYDNVL